MANAYSCDIRDEEWDELTGILLETRFSRPTRHQELRLREILSQRSARAQDMPLGRLLRFGDLVAGLYALSKRVLPPIA